ncbi:MAG: hypothetical protein KME64_22185 [Scytonematopsis contorta HA4267-MV1]|nr:hypothetical protein [Scytonematopsis contorta HA4267-MV1]
MGSREWGVGNGEWGVQSKNYSHALIINQQFSTPYSLLPTPHSLIT